ncbi:MAG: GNAT family N-acetyltransferase [Ichthyobacteriaceae bacterium]|nr:GNAT family N-acetyltransferase [Ichthyobacteriaceae bacterium]
MSNQIRLRALEPTDLAFLYSIENNQENWSVSETIIPFSEYLLKVYLENIDKDITQTKQLRLVIETVNDKEAVGLIDLFDFNSVHSRCGVGVIINKESRELGYASEALNKVLRYCKNVLNLYQVHCEIQEFNTVSQEFFTKHNFIKVGIKTNWWLKGNKYYDVYSYQYVL